ncbi:hypothetical protein B0T14DRAFT_531820 [Immersiella caudata]|uniref:Uncharacterized protein n=1 Tax=Immersiella caudata TaxID=314043 RepID=A0AA39TTQ7_9PEZI|nr:hypothetical protein B0T14DRAFT_531820 [Immersiella caudata]
MWVGGLRRVLDREEGMYTKWGFVAYRVCYGHSEEEWKLFLGRFQKDVKNWGEGVANVEEVREKMEIRWVDGREYGIAEGDVEGARKHFAMNEDRERGEPQGLLAPGFLAADRSSIDSYIHELRMPGQTLVDEADLGPFILVGEKRFDGRSRRALAGFDGTVRVLGSTLIDDVWPTLWWTGITVDTLWDLAVLHPSRVYVGLLVQSQIEGWTRFRNIRDAVLKKAHEWQRNGKLSSRPSGV